MELEPSEDQLLVQRTARDFAERVLVPKAAARDQTGEFPETEMKELGKLGLLAISVPEELGGAGMGPVAYSLALQEIARGDASVAVAMSVTNMVGELIANNGTPAQRERWNPQLASGQLVCGSFALSEPEAGSDPAALRTTATKTATGWVLNGTKQWITTGDHAGVMIVWAVTEPGAGHKGISAFIVPGPGSESPSLHLGPGPGSESPSLHLGPGPGSESPSLHLGPGPGYARSSPEVHPPEGLVVARLEDKLGLRGSSTAQLVFDNVEVPDDAMLGAPGRGFALAMMALDGGRIGISSQAIGIARGALEAAIRYAGERKTFGQPIIKHQAVGNMLADAATWLDAATLMTLRAAYLKETGQAFSQQAAMAKLFSTEHAWKICDIALQVHGGYGYVKDFPVERALRDVRVTRIYEGTSEIQRIVIARGLVRA